jgi:hypothetical protein
MTIKLLKISAPKKELGDPKLAMAYGLWVEGSNMELHSHWLRL